MNGTIAHHNNRYSFLPNVRRSADSNKYVHGKVKSNKTGRKKYSGRSCPKTGVVNRSILCVRKNSLIKGQPFSIVHKTNQGAATNAVIHSPCGNQPFHSSHVPRSNTNPANDRIGS